MNKCRSIVRQWTSVANLMVAGVGLILGTVDAAARDGGRNDEAYDEFIAFFGLSASDRNPNSDPDHDNLSNREEFYLGTDPLSADTDHSGLNDDAPGVAPLCRAYIPWGDPCFAKTNDVSYAWPIWMVAAFRDGGEWIVTSNYYAWHVPAETIGSSTLHMEVDRDVLTNNAILKFSVAASVDASLYLDLYDCNEFVVVSNLGANLVADLGTNITRIVDVPFESYPTVVGLKLRRETGAMTVGDGLLYVDPSMESNSGAIPAMGGSGSAQTLLTFSFPEIQLKNVKGKIIYVDVSRGQDSWSGEIATAKSGDGPKKTLAAGRSSLQVKDTLVIKPGVYKEDLDLSGLDVEVIIEGDVTL